MTEREQRFLMDQRCERCGQIKREAKAYVGTEILCGCPAMTETVTEAVSEEAVEMAALGVARAVRCYERDSAAAKCIATCDCDCRETARAALTAALPLLVAGERERCADIVDQYGADTVILREHQGISVIANMQFAVEVACGQIADAIRDDTPAPEDGNEGG